ncbi:MAG: beta-lactamase family protein [Chloroflexi bacterium]|nr:beta-lactamase family protein [Chloroflexota bacterium]
MADALVQGNKIICNRGFGVRNLESGEPVTPSTRFRIGSITKSMTSLMLATLRLGQLRRLVRSLHG